MKNYVEGESLLEGFESYYGFSRNHVQDKIYSMEKNTILNSDIDKLTELVVQDFILPIVKIDSSKKPQVEDETPVGYRQILLKIKIPLVIEEGIDTVIGIYCNPQRIWGFDYALENGFLITEEWCDVENTKGTVENAINDLKSMLQYKNDQIPRENDSLREYTKNFLEKTKQRLEQNKKSFNELESLSIDLVKKEEEKTSKVKPTSTQTPVTQTNSIQKKPQWDVFISHASEDKGEVAKPFVEKLQSLNLKVWYDEFTLKWGRSLRESIDEGLSNSLFGIVVLSQVFFQKKWTKIELDGLTAIMTTTGKDQILPLRYKISHEEVAKVSPTLAGLFSRSWDEGIDKLANEVKELVEEKKLRQNKF